MLKLEYRASILIGNLINMGERQAWEVGSNAEYRVSECKPKGKSDRSTEQGFRGLDARFAGDNSPD